MNDIDGQTLLLVEDNEDDVFIFKRAYRQAQVAHPLQVVNDGEEAFDYLTGGGVFADRAKYPLPFLVLLDLKLPFKGGLEVLQAIRETPALAQLCVVVLTSSAEERDIARARELRAQAYLVKPPSAATLKEILAAVRARLAGQERLPGIAGDFFADEAGAGPVG
ncbi:MAG TPA: response regulator [Opitutaceae bacterium]